MKYIHYEWIRVTFETARRNKGFCNGLIYWMLNDCWPTAGSWAIIDYQGNPRPGYYGFRRCAKDVVASFAPIDGKIGLYLSNDSLSAVSCNARVSLVKEDRVTLLWEDTIQLAADRTQLLRHFPTPEDGGLLLCDIQGEGFADRSFYRPGPLYIRPTQALRVLEQTEDHITLTADGYVHAAELEGPFLFEENYITLLPGEQKTIAMERYGEGNLNITGYTL